MATLVLSTVGSALGGPVGGAIGALIGQSIDQQLLGGATRGPRVGDLKVQSSSYGTQIPRIYGSMRVAGTVIWATDLVEGSETSGAKGQPDTVYNYSVSLAVAVSSRPAKSIGRIWADGKLLRGAEGDFKVNTKFRFFDGSEDQDVDAFIASTEGISETPAYRGLTLAVFEGLELAEFGNRIPFLTFEVFGDERAPTIGEILADASSGLIASTAAQPVVGYAAYGKSIKAGIAPLVECFDVELFDDGAGFVSPDRAMLHIADDEFGNTPDGETGPRLQREQDPARSLPSMLKLSYYDPALDFQSGEARATSAERRGAEEQRELAAAISASDAKSLAQQMIAREWARRDKLTLRLPPRYLDLQPGSRLILDLHPATWRVEESTIDAFVVQAQLRPDWTGSAQVPAASGRIMVNRDEVASDVTLALFDLPDVLKQGLTGPALLLAASSPSRGWKPCGVDILAGKLSVRMQTARRKTVLGRALTVLAEGDPYLIDRDRALGVELIDADQWLLNCDDDALVAGSNLAVLGSEVIQFARALPLGGGRFRLTQLLRGRAGTEWAMASHSVGEAFALIAPDALRTVPLPAWSSGTSAVASADNLSGTSSSSGSVLVTAEALRPPSPVALHARTDFAGNLGLGWTRRSRNGFAWVDEIDAPLGETSERYRVTISGANGSIEFETSVPALQIGAEQMAGAGSGAANVEVRQIGDAGASRPAVISVTL